MQKAKDIFSKLYTTIFHTNAPPNPDLFLTPNHSLEILPLNINNFHTDTISIDRSEYDQLKESLNELKLLQTESLRMEEEYKRILIDYNTALSFYIDKKEFKDTKECNQNCKIIIKNYQIENEKLRKNEKRMRDHLKNLNNDMMNCEERAEAYKIIAMERIDQLRMENQCLKEMADVEEMKRKSLEGGREEDVEVYVQDIESKFENFGLK